jgi:tRNA A-37 threonylcarbamoyl transferase component Bud32
MEKEKSKIVVRDIHTQQVLFECSVEQSEKAYQFAAEMEEMGLDIEVLSPTLSETLSHSLGLSEEQLQKYKASVDEEMETHEGSCCFEEGSDKIH